MGQHGSASGSILLGLDGFEVTAAEVTDDEWRLAGTRPSWLREVTWSLAKTLPWWYWTVRVSGIRSPPARPAAGARRARAQRLMPRPTTGRRLPGHARRRDYLRSKTAAIL